MKPDARTERTKQSIVALCHQGLELYRLFREVSRLLQRVVHFDTEHWLTADPDTLLPTGLVSDHFPPEMSVRVAENELLEDDFNKLWPLATGATPVGILSQCTEGVLTRSRRYCNILAPLGWEHELRAALRLDTRCWGYLCLHRVAGQAAFTPSEADFVAHIGPPLAAGIRKALLTPMISIEATADGPGLIIVDERMAVEAMTEAAEHWLQEILGRAWRPEAPLPDVVYAVAAHTRALSQGRLAARGGVAQTRVATRAGRWIIVHGSQLHTPEREGSRTAIIVEASRPSQVVSFVLESYALTAREQQVLALVLQGASTVAVAKTLYISPYTVQEHLKSIFAKTGVNSRRELAGRLFFEHYAPGMMPHPLHGLMPPA